MQGAHKGWPWWPAGSWWEGSSALLLPPWQGPECLLVVGGLFFDLVDYNLPHVWPLLGLGLDDLLINRDICCCL